MGLTKRKDSYYVEFRVLDDGEALKPASGGGGQLKRWKVGSLNKTVGKQQEAILKTQLLTRQIASPGRARAQSITFRQWAETYVGLEQIRKLATYADRKLKVSHLVELFGDRPLVSIAPDDVAVYRAQRVQYQRLTCGECGKPLGKATCSACGWKRTDSSLPVSMQT